MPCIDTAECRLHFEVDGREGNPWLILSNSLGTTLDMWAPQMPALLPDFLVVRYDTRGHGQSSIPPGPYDIAHLGKDVITLMDALGIARAHFCGLSMGAMTGMWLGIHQSSRIERLALCSTAARIGPPEVWNARIAKVESEGMASIVPAIIDRWFTPTFQQHAPEKVAQVRQMLLNSDPAGYTANCAAVRDMDQRDGVAAISAPTLVIAGTHDQSTPPAEGKMVADRIVDARFVELDAAHLSNWETADAFNAELRRFLTS